MFFNPLFISNASNGNAVESTKKNKFTNSNYLFANIINVSKEKLSFAESNVELDEINKKLFNYLKSNNFPLIKETDANTNQFISDELALSSFLSQIMEQINEANFNTKNIDDENNNIEADVLPEQINNIIKSVSAGNKISIPFNNNGKVAFVEIQNFDKALIDGNLPKGIKLGNTSQNEIKLTDDDINKVISNISIALREVFNSENITMATNKVETIITNITNDFSKLIQSNNETFQPQKNILANLIGGIEKEFKLNCNESNELKKVIVTEFAKLINDKSVSIKSTTPKTNLATLKELSEELSLTPSEQKLINSFNLAVVNPIELKEKIEFLLSKSDNYNELKPLLEKTNIFINNNFSQPKQIVSSEKLPIQELSKELNLSDKEVELVKSFVTEKISLPELAKQLKVEAIKVNDSPVLKAVTEKLNSFLNNSSNVKANFTIEKLPIQELAKELNLTTAENKQLNQLNTEIVDFVELKYLIKSKILSEPNSKELKSLLSKIELIDIPAKSSDSNKKELINNIDLTTKEYKHSKTKIVDKVKIGLKNIFASSNSENKEVASTKPNFAITIKNEKSQESFLLNNLEKNESKSPELLKKSIYTSKESLELTRLKIIPLNEEVAKKFELKTVDNEFKRASFKKVTGEFKFSNSGNNSEKGYSESENLANNNSNLNNSEISVLKNSKLDSAEKTFAKQVSDNFQATDSKNEDLKKKFSQATKSNDTKITETIMPKTAFVENQIRNIELKVIPKAVLQKLDIKNIKEEISNLIQKGEKKSVEFQLNPENFGKMNIKLEVINKMVSAFIKVENETTQQVIQNNLEGLKTSLNQQGLQLSSLNVSLADAEGKNNRYFKQKKKNNNAFNIKVTGFDDKFAHKNLGYNNYDFIA